jgi:transcriptional regulator with XRE-family HTH domain
MVGERIRQARSARGWSLTDVAGQADISVATLSRIERNKQTIDVATFLLLMRVLEVDPAELLSDDVEGRSSDAIDPIVSKITSLRAQDRARLWRALATTGEGRAPSKSDVRTLSMQVEELVAQIDLVKHEIENVRKRLRPRK